MNRKKGKRKMNFVGFSRINTTRMYNVQGFPKDIIIFKAMIFGLLTSRTSDVNKSLAQHYFGFRRNVGQK